MQIALGTLHAMVQKATPLPGRLGRRPSFDREAVVSAAIAPFWAKGFEATTLSDLEGATGIDRSTIYNSFGGKSGLYRSAAAAYIDQSDDILFMPLYEGTAGIGDIVEFLDRLAQLLKSGENPPGCLIVNDMAADIDHDATTRYLSCLQTGFQLALKRSSKLDGNGQDKSAQRSKTLTAAVLGVNIVHRNSPNAALALNLVEGLREEVCSWAGD